MLDLGDWEPSAGEVLEGVEPTKPWEVEVASVEQELLVVEASWHLVSMDRLVLQRPE